MISVKSSQSLYDYSLFICKIISKTHWDLRFYHYRLFRAKLSTFLKISDGEVSAKVETAHVFLLGGKSPFLKLFGTILALFWQMLPSNCGKKSTLGRTPVSQFLIKCFVSATRMGSAMRISPPSVETAIRWCVLLPSNSLPLNSIISYHLCRTCGAGDGEKGRAVFKEKEKRSNEERSRELWPKKIWSKEVWWQEKGARGAQFRNVRCCRYLNYINWEAPFPDAAISFPLISGVHSTHAWEKSKQVLFDVLTGNSVCL